MGKLYPDAHQAKDAHQATVLIMPSNSPLLSICIPAYNRPAWLKRAVSSILATPTNQQPQVEIIVSDDSTTSDCQKVVHELLVNWQGNWHYDANSPSLGMAGNWNQCIKMASGEYVLVLHDDDYLETKAPSKILQTLQQNPNASALLFGVNVVTPQQQIRKQQFAKSQHYLNPEAALTQVLTDSSFIRFPGMVLKKEVFQTVGYFDDTIGGIADIQMWVRVCQKYGLLRIPTITANYTVHANALTMKMFNTQVLKELEGVFNEVKSQHLLSPNVLEICKTNYFHQFILAGTVRYIKTWEIKIAREIFKLFNQIDLTKKQVKPKWKIIKFILRLVLFKYDL